jgi:ppGpp synthetase/RelA/SpoT-type nucleotidyltranferase
MNESDNTNVNKTILRDYDTNATVLRDFKNSCGRLIAELLRLERITVHSVNARVKERHKLQEKLTREGKAYTCIADVTDIVGARVITHFEDEVDKIGSLIEREFIVHPDRSVDKRKLLDPDRFGYLSLHYICSLSDDRLKLAENRRFRGLVCEIQIRSILQHAWAEIEHDLGYKSGYGVPAPIRRRFSRLAGLLEVADQEFAAIRNELANYAERVKTEIKTSPSELGIDKINVKRLEVQDSVLELIAKAMPTLGINTIAQLNDALMEHSALVLYEAKARLANINHPQAEGFSMTHLMVILMALQGGEEGIKKGFQDLGLKDLTLLSDLPSHVMAIIESFKKHDQAQAAKTPPK